MTREERHIEVLNRLLENMDVYDSIQPTTERKKAIKAAIKALKNHDTFMKYAYSQGKHDALSQEYVGSTQKHVENALDMRCEDQIVETMAKYIKDNSTPMLIELVIKAIKKVEGKE